MKFLFVIVRRFACWLLDITETDQTIDRATTQYEKPEIKGTAETTWIIAYVTDIPNDPYHQMVRLRGVFGSEIAAIRVMNACKINSKYAVRMSIAQFVSKLINAYEEGGLASVYEFKAND